MTQDEFVILSTYDMRAHLDSIGTDSTGSREELVDRHKQLSDDTASGEPADNWPKQLSRVAFPGILGEFVDAACNNSEADPAAVAMTFLIRFGIECGTNKYVQVGENRHYPRTNANIVGDSSKARKGVSAGPTKALFDPIPNHCRTSPGPLSSGEGIAWAVRDEVREWKVDKKTNIGEWVITDPGVTDKRLFIQEEEFANALTSTKIEGNRLSSIIRTSYDDGTIEPLTKNNRIKATNAHVGIVGHITLPELKDQLSQKEMLNGFGNRIVWVCSRRQRLVPRPRRIDDTVMSGFRELLQQRITDAQVPGEISFSDDADELWLAEYSKLSAAYGGAAGCMVNRGEAHVTRLALIYALLAGRNSIELEDLQAALEFWRYCLQSAFFIFGQTSSDRRRTKILDALSLANDNNLSKDEIRKKCFSGHIKAEDLDELLRTMGSDGLITITTEQTTGVPRKIITLVLFKREKRDKPTSSAPYQANNAYNAVDNKKTDAQLVADETPNFDWED